MISWKVTLFCEKVTESDEDNFFSWNQDMKSAIRMIIDNIDYKFIISFSHYIVYPDLIVALINTSFSVSLFWKK